MSDQLFWDQTAAKYAKKPIPDQAAYQDKLHCIRSALLQIDYVTHGMK